MGRKDALAKGEELHEHQIRRWLAEENHDTRLSIHAGPGGLVAEPLGCE